MQDEQKSSRLIFAFLESQMDYVLNCSLLHQYNYLKKSQRYTHIASEVLQVLQRCCSIEPLYYISLHFSLLALC